MHNKCEFDIVSIAAEIKSIIDYDITIKKRKAEMKHIADLIEQIVTDGAISDTNLHMLVDEILITEKKIEYHNNAQSRISPALGFL